MREEAIVEAVIGEKSGYPNGVEVCAIRSLEHEIHVGPTALGRQPILDLGIVRLGLQKGVSTLRDAHARKRRLRLIDQRAVKRDLSRLPVIHVEHGLKMPTKQRSALCV